jgi:Uncharacterized conserved protein, COG4198
LIYLKLKAFRPLYFNTTLSDVVSPPYDTITQEQSRDLLAKEYNIYHLSRQDSREDAENIFRKWIGSGTLRQMDHDVLIVLSQEFPGVSENSVRFGVIGLVDSQQVSGEIIPHEDTFEKAVIERRDLMLALQSQVEPIFLAVESTSLDRAIKHVIRDKTPYGVFEEPSGVTNSVFCIESQDEIDSISSSVSNTRAIVADGHHRLKATREIYSMQNQDRDFWKYSLSYITSLYNDSLFISGIHRVLTLQGGKKSIMEKISRDFIITDFNTYTEDGNIWIFDGHYHRIVPRHSLSITPPEVIKEIMLRKDLGMNLEEMERSISYRYSVADAISAAEKSGGVAILSPNWNKAEFMKTLEKGNLLPQKSTYFYPKIPSGIGIYSNIRRGIGLSLSNKLENPERC